MPESRPSATSPRPPGLFAHAGWGDILAVLLLFAGGYWFLQDMLRWGAWWVFIGDTPTGDAKFWWSGVLEANAGNIAKNPNLTFRMGYAMVGGIITSVFGTDLFVFHKVLVVAFLLAACLLYLVMIPATGRLAAFTGAALVVFNPFTGEWLANPTSDGVGMICNMLALACFVAGLRDQGRLWAILLFAFFLAVAGLTRPLMNIFLAPALGIIAFARFSVLRRAIFASAAVVTYFVPVGLWMVTLYLNTHVWSLAGHEGSIFYSASDPAIQQWTPTMYDAVAERARARLKAERLSPSQLNDEFRREAVENYLKHWPYHVERVVPTAWAVCESVARSHHHYTTVSNPAPSAQTVRTVFLALAAAAAAAWALRQGRLPGAILAVAMGAFLALTSHAQAVVLMAASILFSLALFHRSQDRLFPILGWFFLTAEAAMYLVGGVWRQPHVGWHVNGLGVRLTSQFAFAGELMIGLAVVGIAWVRLPERAARWFGAGAAWYQRLEQGGARLAKRAEQRLFPPAVKNFFAPRPPVGRGLARGFLAIAVVAAVLLALGSGRMLATGLARARTEPRPYPPLAELQAALEQKLAAQGVPGPLRVAAAESQVPPLVNPANKDRSAYILTQGAPAPFIWNVPGQQRAIFSLTFQDKIQPAEAHRFYFEAEVPQNLDKNTWARRQGAWIVRRQSSQPPPSHLYYYNSFPEVRAYIPLTEDGASYDLARAIWFPETMTLSQMQARGWIQIEAAETKEVGWPEKPGVRLDYPREVQLASDGGPVAIEARVSAAARPRKLSFAFAFEGLGKNPPPPGANLVVLTRPSPDAPWSQLLEKTPPPAVSSSRDKPPVTPWQAVELALDAEPVDAVRIVATGLPAGQKLRVAEWRFEGDPVGLEPAP